MREIFKFFKVDEEDRPETVDNGTTGFPDRKMRHGPL